MEMLAWNPDWETGNPDIDRQHRKLMAHFDQLFQAVARRSESEHISRTLDFLGDYLESHFRMEEELMESTSYPARPEHMAIHDGLRARVSQLSGLQREVPGSVTEEVATLLADWMISHIGEQDRALAQYLRKRTQGPGPV